MGEAELNKATNELIIRSVFFFYGDAATPDLATTIATDIQTHWNEPQSIVTIRHHEYKVKFEIQGFSEPTLKPETVWYNDNPRNNYFRLETFAIGNISFVDGIGSNTGYFKIDNLLQTSTTAAHEYGHTLGLVHPEILDIRGTKTISIMYPRGTYCDSEFQYISTANPGEHGGFLDPRHRRVINEDILALKLHKLDFDDRGIAKVGEFTSLYHQKHVEGYV